MKYIGTEISKADSVKKHAEHIENNDIVYATSDGNAFVGDRAKPTAYSHAANYRPALHVFPLKGIDPAEAAAAAAAEGATEEKSTAITMESLMKLTKPKLVVEALAINAPHESDNNKDSIAQSILDTLANPPVEKTPEELEAEKKEEDEAKAKVEAEEKEKAESEAKEKEELEAAEAAKKLEEEKAAAEPVVDFDSLMKLTSPQLKEKADGLELKYDDEITKKPLAEAILVKLAAK